MTRHVFVRSAVAAGTAALALLAPAASQAATWTTCASEGGACSFSGTKYVRYGTAPERGEKVSASISCSDAAFGTDPAIGIAKTCAYDAAATPFTKTQFFQLANPDITAVVGDTITLRVRVFGIPMSAQQKVFTHFVPETSTTLVADVLNHYTWVPAQYWYGYGEYDYPVQIPPGTATGTYRILSGLALGISPYTSSMSQVTCNGVPVVDGMCHVGTVTVLGDPTWMRYTPIKTWTP